MNKIQKLWFWASNIGISNDLEHFEEVKIKVLNQVVAIIAPLQLLMNISFIINLDILNTLIGFFILFLLLSLWFFNLKQKFEIARVVLNTIFPLIMFGTGVMCGERTGLQYNLMIFFAATFFFHRSLHTKLILVGYNIFLVFGLMYYWNNYNSLYELLLPPYFSYFSYLLTTIILITLIQRFVVEMANINVKNQVLLKSLESNNKELKNANEALERFAYVASHDLKTPLRTILGFTQLLERDYGSDKTKYFPLYLSQIKQGAKQMNELIKNTLEYSRLNHLEEEKKWIDLNEIIANIHVAYITDESIEINTSTLPKIFGEENQMLSLFQNLIENGIKYNEKRIKKIDISAIDTPYSVRIIVKDNGIGISEKFHEQIFTMFKRLHTKQQYEGTGLGLAICEKIVEKMNGQISLDSIECKGTTFYIDLPKHEKIL
ncbi:MAG: ATP-binding protein [Saprospiraceae bacterium]